MTFIEKVVVQMKKSLFYAIVHAKELVDWVVVEHDSGEPVERYIIEPDSAGAFVHYILAADSIDEAMDEVRDHAFANYLDRGEISEISELDYEDAASNPIGVEMGFDLTDPNFFEVTDVVAYQRSLGNTLRKLKRRIKGWF